MNSTMMRRARVLAGAACLMLGLTGLAACGGDSGSSSSASDSASEVTVSFLPVAGLAPLVYAQNNGLFEDEGITVSNIDIKTPPDGIANLVSGRAQMAFINVGGLAAALDQGVDLRAVSPVYFFNTEEGDQGVWTAAGSDITRPKDLEGKKVGLLGLANNFQAMVLKAVSDDGGDPSKIEFSVVGGADVPSAIRNGTIDAGQVVEPYLTPNLADLSPVIKSPASILETQPSIIGYLVTSGDFLESNPEAVEAFKAAYEKAIEDVTADDQLARDAIASFTEIEPDVLEKMILPVWSTDMSIENAEEQLDLLVEVGYLEEKPDMSKVFDQ